MQYRREIDGLRALAVVPVVLFHAGIAGFPGGYVGVDVFFVISGYLITSILREDMERGGFSFAAFYERRARRILPALFVVMLACLPFAWSWQGPEQFADFAKSGIATLIFASNLYFWNQSGYFAPQSETQPLLHTWSLAVEEQFYLFFPVILILLYRSFLRDRMITSLVLIGAASFLACQWGWRNAPDANFYLAPFRTWELMSGAICAFVLREAPPRPSEAPAILGIAFITLSILILGEHTPFPSSLTLLPVAGTCLVILYAREGTAACRLLSLRPLVAIGLVSYSFYLWHQPIFVFARARWPETHALMPSLVLIALAFFLAALSWRWIERPFRHPSPRMGGGRWQLAVLGSGATAIAAAMLYVGAQGGVPERFDARALAHVATGREVPAMLEQCKLGYAPARPRSCLNNPGADPVFHIALIGDSHASQWTEALNSAGDQHGWQIETFAKSACPMTEIRFAYYRLKREYRECEQWRNAVHKTIERGKYDLVIISQSVSYLFQDEPFAVKRGTWDEGLKAMALRLDAHHTRWMLLSDNPQFRDRHPVDCVFRSRVLAFTPDGNCNVKRQDALDLPGRAVERAAVENSRYGSWLDLSGYFCDATWCRPEREDYLLMSDGNHLSRRGAFELARPIFVAITERLNPVASADPQSADAVRAAASARPGSDRPSANPRPADSSETG